VIEVANTLPRDPLTGLFNLKYAIERLKQEEERASRASAPYCVMLTDVDRLKEFNDVWGTSAGDHALSALAGRLRGHCRKGDLLARTGGDEFLLCLPETSHEVAAKIAERVRASIESMSLPNRMPHITVSIGLTRWRPEESALEALRRADDRLHRAKTAGRNQTLGD
jgi:diguanylate cyclase (GGDEF)-like protein